MSSEVLSHLRLGAAKHVLVGHRGDQAEAVALGGLDVHDGPGEPEPSPPDARGQGATGRWRGRGGRGRAVERGLPQGDEEEEVMFFFCGGGVSLHTEPTHSQSGLLLQHLVPQSSSVLLRPPQSSSDLLRPPQTSSVLLRPPQSSSDLLSLFRLTEGIFQRVGVIGLLSALSLSLSPSLSFTAPLLFKGAPTS